MRVGCHVSIAGGIQNAPQNGFNFGCEIIQIFTRSPQGGLVPKITDKICEDFKFQKLKFEIKEVYIHAPYYINFASANNRIRYGSVSVIRDELERGTLLGAKYVMTHLGSAKGQKKEEAITKTIEMVKKTLHNYKGATKLLFENSAGAGEIIGDDLRELAQIITSIDNSIIDGICLDTQHSFAFGYDWRNFEKTLKRIDEEIGLDKIKLIHANDSQSDCGSQKDRHEHLGKGKIGVDAFKNIVFFAKKNDIDIICETEWTGVKEDVKFLKNLRKTCLN